MGLSRRNTWEARGRQKSSEQSSGAEKANCDLSRKMIENTATREDRINHRAGRLAVNWHFSEFLFGSLIFELRVNDVSPGPHCHPRRAGVGSTLP